ncbi:MAG: TetR/AcrR family transcriptional regulator [Alistipes sp.]|nr:TetR/AcrR family transcriptional regulator [Alistipes sp.]
MSKREKVIKRAAEMIAELGVKSLRVDDLASDLGISKRTLYEMFGDKEELLYHSIKEILQSEASAIKAKMTRAYSGIPSLFETFDAMMSGSAVRKRITENLAKFYPELYERVMTENREYGLATLREKLNHLVEEGLISEMVNIDLSITMFYYTSMGLMRRHGRLVLPDGVSELEAFRYTIVNFFRGIATVKGVEQIDAYLAAKTNENK